MLCTGALYSYINPSLLLISNIGLSARASHGVKEQNSQNTGICWDKACGKLSADIDFRTEFGHQKSDLIIQSKFGADDLR